MSNNIRTIIGVIAIGVTLCLIYGLYVCMAPVPPPVQRYITTRYTSTNIWTTSDTRSSNIIEGKLKQRLNLNGNHTRSRTFSHKNHGIQLCSLPLDNLTSYSIDVTQDDITHFRASLPPLLPCFKNPCWMERVLQHFTYHKNFYWNLKYFIRREKKFMASMEKVLTERCPNRSQPCWRIRCYPYFYILGPPKAGTTDLYESLTRHPQIELNGRKETQFWPRTRFGTSKFGIGKATFADFLDLYDLPAEQLRIDYMSNGTHYKNHIIGEFTPDNYYYQSQWRSWPGNEKLSEPQVTLAHQLYNINPATKVIFSIREPIERAVSHYLFGRGNVENINERFHSDLERFTSCQVNYTVRHCLYDQVAPILGIGVYIVFIRDWLEAFSRDQVHVMLFDEYKEDRVKVVNNIAEFLDLDRLPAKQQKELNNRVKVSLKQEKKVSLNSTLLKKLQNFYQPWNEELESFLVGQRLNWKY